MEEAPTLRGLLVAGKGRCCLCERTPGELDTPVFWNIKAVRFGVTRTDGPLTIAEAVRIEDRRVSLCDDCMMDRFSEIYQDH